MHSITPLQHHDDLLLRNISFRMGKFFQSPFIIDIDYITSISDPDLAHVFAIDGRVQEFLPWNDIRAEVHRESWGWTKTTPSYPWSIGRSCAFLNYVIRGGFNSDFVINFADAACLDYRYRIGQGRDVPVIQYVRLRGRQDIILFPLVNYMEVGGANVPNRIIDDVPWNNKKSAIVWRGVLSGSISEGGCFRTVHSMLRSLHSDQMLLDDFDNVLKTFPRALAANLSHKYSFLDSCLVNMETLPPSILLNTQLRTVIESLYGAVLQPCEQAFFRYILCLEGNDSASSLPWSLATNSLVIMPNPTWETIFHCDLIPWIHYVPVENNLSDIEEKFYWCEEHQSQVTDMVAEANAYITPYLDSRWRNIVDYAVLEMYAKNYLSAGRNTALGYGAPIGDASRWTPDSSKE